MTCARSSSSNASDAEQFRRVFHVLRRELDAGAAERLGHRSGRIGQHRHVRGHRFEQRRAEAFVLAQRDVDRRVAVVDRQVLVRHRAGEDETLVRAAGTRAISARIVGVVPRHGIVLADEDEAIVGVDVALVVLGQPDVILDLLVRRDPADEQEVHEVVVVSIFSSAGRRDGLRDARQVDGERQDAGRREPHGLELRAG